MPQRLLKAPLCAAFFCATIMAGCTADQSVPVALATQCPGGSTPIASVQGDSPESPMQDQQVRVKGIVTLVQSGHGLYIEEPGSDADDGTSNAIFIQSTELPNGIETGSLISARGKVAEIGQGRYR